MLEFVEEVLKYIGIILGSSVGVALINWAATARKGEADRRASAQSQTQREEHEATLQAQKERHEAKLRRQADHDAARATFLPLAEALVLYFTKEAYEIHWDEVGAVVFPSTERPLLDTQAAVVDTTRTIMWGHPTVEVREQARLIYGRLGEYWFDVDRAQERSMNGEEFDLSQAEANGLETAAEELVKLVHAQPMPEEELTSGTEVPQ